MKIIFICTGNTCRSPMAEQLGRDIFRKRNIDADISSAGISVYFPSPASYNAVGAMKRRGFDLSGHISKEITENDVADADLILTMTQGHKKFLLGFCPEHTGKIFTLGEYAGENIPIEDPYGTDIANYIKCAEQLERLIDMAAEKIIQEKKG